MSSIDELMEGKQPGEIKICPANREPWDGWFFRPMYKDASNDWHGPDNENQANTWPSVVDRDWQIWQPPKKTVVRYLWAYAGDRELSKHMYSEAEAKKMFKQPCEWQRLDWSATEMEE